MIGVIGLSGCATSPSPDWADPALERDLQEAPMKQMRSLQQFLEEEKGIAWEGSNPLYIVELEGGMRAVFRHEDEPWGSQAEVVGYRVSRALGLDLVPVTVPRTLHREEVEDWPFEGEVRVGSLQVYVDAAPTTEAQWAQLDPDDRANIEIVSFLLGRYDNHPGNLLIDGAGQPVLIDFEGALDRQRVRWGEFPFLKRGGRAAPPASITGHPASAPFPFDGPELLVDPTLEELEATFGPWWGQYWPEGMRGLHRMLDHIPERTVPFVVWDERLWVQVRVASRHPAHTERFPVATLEALRALDRAALEALLIAPFSAGHVRDIMERREQVLRAAQE